MKSYLTESPMGTVEIIIVFSALMALIALVTVGIDWIGKPLKHRRFIPRLYRFDDEKLPIDAYGNTTFDAIEPPQVVVPSLDHPPVTHPPMAAPPIPYPAQIPPTGYEFAPGEYGHATVPVDLAQPAAVEARTAQPAARQPEPRPVARVDPDATTTSSAFSDSLAATGNNQDGTDTAFADRAMIAGRDSPDTPTDLPPTGPWKLGMAIDTAVEGHKPSLATKAERFWRSTASSSGTPQTSHFDSVDIERMRSGKAPRRVNPRTGRSEAMQLTGLRRASAPEQVRMRWPDEVVDPWNPS